MKHSEPKTEEVKKLTGEKRVDALVKALKDSHGFNIPEEVLPDEEKD